MSKKIGLKFNFVIIFSAVIFLTMASAVEVNAANAGRVISYVPGSGAAAGYDNPQTALGVSPTDTGSWEGTVYYVTPFNNPYSSGDIVSIGLGGELVLELENYALPTAGAEIGIFTYQQLIEDGWGSGKTTDPVELFRQSQQAIVDVSEDGLSWVSLNSGLSIAMNIPANAFNDAAATIPADYGMEFTGVLSDFDGMGSLQATIDVFGGSAGGNWLDISETGLEKVGFIRFSVPSDAAFSFELEGISLATDSIGMAIPEPVTILLLGFGGLFLRNKKRN